jgi:peptidoglycan/LPS O-acetylase OafA/YrhL
MSKTLEKPYVLNTGYLPTLDGVRGVAVLLILLFHFGRMKDVTLRLEIGWIGVQLFFVLSGFLITKILLANKNQSLKSYLRHFFLRRSLRIFPLYYLYLSFLLLLFIAIDEPKDILHYGAHLLTYTYNFSILSADWQLSRMYVHLWSLSVEEQFYIIWPFAVFFLSTQSLKRLMLALILLIPIFRFLLKLYLATTFEGKDQEFIGNAVYWFPLSNFDAFAIGGAINFLKEDFLSLGKKAWLIITFSLCVIGGVLNGTFLEVNGFFDITTLGYPLHSTANNQHVWSYTLLNFFFAVLLWNVLEAKASVFNFKPLQEIGKISYGMYVFHFLILVMFEKMKIHVYTDLVTLFIYLTICVAVAKIIYSTVEKKILLLKNKI